MLMSYLPFLLIVVTSAAQPDQSDAEWKTTETGQTSEYCSVFNARCLKNEVIVMTEARYGRMKVGNCLKDEAEEVLAAFGNDRRFIGCSSDVLRIMDEKCSLTDQCQVKLFYDTDLQQQKPCLGTMKNYLEAGYECASVVEPDRSCTVSVTSSAQHLMTPHSSSTELSCGSRHQPWTLEAPTGQQINVSLLDFEGAVNQRDGHCLQYGYIIDREANKNVSICGLVSKRKQAVYKSAKNILHVFLSKFGESESNSREKNLGILLRFQVVGCSNIVPPEDTWLRRNENEAVVGCYSSHQTWRLLCLNNLWTGVIGNCSRDARSLPVEGIMKESQVNYEVVVAVTIGVIGIIVCVLIVICGAVCLKRYSANKMIQGRTGHHTATNCFMASDRNQIINDKSLPLIS